jgi:glycosyltransferase involved in cell wall biosynthesis
MKEKNSIWVTWEKQIRNESMSLRLGADYYPIVVEGSRPKRYLVCGIRTLKLLYKNRKKTIFVQNPSIVLSLIAVIMKFFCKFNLVIDAHNSGVFPGSFLQPMANFINKHATYVIVTNLQLAEFIKTVGGKPLILPDPLPDVSCEDDDSSVWSRMPVSSVMVISSWASDEPYLEIIQAADLKPEVTFYITGNSKGRALEYRRTLPSNLILTGFVSENDYRIILKNAGVVIDLTTREDCLVCGAYEAISAGKPVILSDTFALKSYFDKEAYYTKNYADSISERVKDIFLHHESISLQAKGNSQCIEARWNKLFLEASAKLFE